MTTGHSNNLTTDPRTIIAFSAANLLSVTISWLFFIVFPIYLRKELEFSEARIGVLISVYTCTMLLTMAPLGFLSDKLSPKRLVQIGVLGKVLYAFGVSRVRSYFWLIPLQVLGGAAEVLTLICLVSLYFKNLGRARRGMAIGIFGAAAFFGYAAGPFLSGCLKGLNFSYSEVFFVAACVGVVLLGVVMFLRDSKPVAFRVFEYVKDIRRPEVTILLIVVIGLSIHVGVERKSLPLVLSGTIGLDDMGIAWLFAIIGIVNALSTFGIGRWFDRSQRMLYFVAAGMAVSGIFQILTPYARGFRDILIIRVIHLSGDAVIVFGISILTATIFPKMRMGGNSGFLYFFRMLGAALGAMIASTMDSRWGSYRPSFLFSGLALIAAGSAFVFGHKAVRKVRRSLTRQAEEAENAGGMDIEAGSQDQDFTTPSR